MKRTICLLGLFSFILCSSCILCTSCSEDYSEDPTLMPPVTQTGADTFGCLIDGWVYTSGRFGKPRARFVRDEAGDYVLIGVNVGLFDWFHMKILSPKAGETVVYTDASLNNQQTFPDGTAHISRMDNGVFSGTFEGTGLSHGRFDLRLTSAP